MNSNKVFLVRHCKNHWIDQIVKNDGDKKDNIINFISHHGDDFGKLLSIENFSQIFKNNLESCLSIMPYFKPNNWMNDKQDIIGVQSMYPTLGVLIYLLSFTDSSFGKSFKFEHMDLEASAKWVWGLYCNNGEINHTLQQLFY